MLIYNSISGSEIWDKLISIPPTLLMSFINATDGVYTYSN